MPFKTANSSFIFDRRRRSIKLCAVFLAIFRPAALVADGCFFLDAEPPSLAAGAVAAVAVAAGAVLPLAAFPPVVDAGADADADSAAGCFFSSCCNRGFIWMILRDLVGGGGSAKTVLSLEAAAVAAAAAAAVAAEGRLRDLTTSAGCIG